MIFSPSCLFLRTFSCNGNVLSFESFWNRFLAVCWCSSSCPIQVLPLPYSTFSLVHAARCVWRVPLAPCSPKKNYRGPYCCRSSGLAWPVSLPYGNHCLDVGPCTLRLNAQEGGGGIVVTMSCRNLFRFSLCDALQTPTLPPIRWNGPCCGFACQAKHQSWGAEGTRPSVWQW